MVPHATVGSRWFSGAGETTLSGPRYSRLTKRGACFAAAATGKVVVAAPIKAIQKANTDPKVVMMQTMQKTARVGSNGGTAAGLVGSYDEVAARISAFHAAGVELFMLQFQPFEAEMERFAKEIIPRVRASQPVTPAEKSAALATLR